MNVSIIGAGYVGLTTAAFISTIGHKVTCVDKDEDKINQLISGSIPIYEPKLEDILSNNREQLHFTTNLKKAVIESSVIIVTVGTPAQDNGSTDLSFVNNVMEEITDCISSFKTLIIKSTVPTGTNEHLAKLLVNKGVSQNLFRIVSNPEFLREGSAIHDMFHPDRTVIGIAENDDTSLKVLTELYSGYEDTLIITSLTGAEMIKYASNAFLATKISFINELARICDSYAVDVNQVAKGMGLDPRIGEQFLQAGIGYGGSCFPKDVSSLYHVATTNNLDTPILEATQQVNNTQADYFIKKINKLYPDPASTHLTVLGIAFKPNTDDIRSSPAIRLIDHLVDIGYTVTTHDPRAIYSQQKKKNVTQLESIEQAITGADALIIATDWDEYKQLNWYHVKEKLKGNNIFDARNCLDPALVKKAGLHYTGIGRS